jgi:hypothetical protein
MRIAVLSVAGLLALSGCNSMQQDNLGACEQALFGAGISSPAKLLSVALTTPACVALGAEAISSADQQGLGAAEGAWYPRMRTTPNGRGLGWRRQIPDHRDALYTFQTPSAHRQEPATLSGPPR